MYGGRHYLAREIVDTMIFFFLPSKALAIHSIDKDFKKKSNGLSREVCLPVRTDDVPILMMIRWLIGCPVRTLEAVSN